MQQPFPPLRVVCLCHGVYLPRSRPLVLGRQPAILPWVGLFRADTRRGVSHELGDPWCLQVNVFHDRGGVIGVVEFDTREDLKTAIADLDGAAVALPPPAIGLP